MNLSAQLGNSKLIYSRVAMIRFFFKKIFVFIYALFLVFSVQARDDGFYFQATTQLAATNFDYVSSSYFNSSIEGFYNFESSPFIIGAGIGQIYGTTDNLYLSNSQFFNSSFNVPYLTIFGGVLLRPIPKIKNVTAFRIAQSFSGSSNCNPSSGYTCNPSTSSVNLLQFGVRNSTMYFFTSNFYASFNAGVDINNFTFSPAFSTSNATPISSRSYNNPGPNLGFSVGYNF